MILDLTEPELEILDYVLNQIDGTKEIQEKLSLYPIDISLISQLYAKVDKLENY